MAFLFSNVFGVWLVNTGASLQALKLHITHITSCRNVFNIEHMSYAVFVGF